MPDRESVKKTITKEDDFSVFLQYVRLSLSDGQAVLLKNDVRVKL